MKVKLEKRFLKKLKRIERKDQIRILAKLKMLEEGKKTDLIRLKGYE